MPVKSICFKFNKNWFAIYSNLEINFLINLMFFSKLWSLSLTKLYPKPFALKNKSLLDISLDFEE